MQIERTAHAKRTKSTSQKTATQKAKPKKAASKPPVSKKTPRKSGVGKTIKDKNHYGGIHPMQCRFDCRDGIQCPDYCL